MVFGHGICLEIFSFPIDLVGGNMNESLDCGAIFGALKKNVGSVDVRLSESQ